MAQDSNLALQQKQIERTKLSPFEIKYYLAVPNLKRVFIRNWSVIKLHLH